MKWPASFNGAALKRVRKVLHTGGVLAIAPRSFNGAALKRVRKAF